MLSLESERWSELRHAYGSAADVPALLKQLRGLPEAVGEAEPWFSLWSALAHQGDVYSASFAAVPHVVAAARAAPTEAGESFFQFPAWVEICRAKGRVEVPRDLQASYFEALGQLPGLAGLALSRKREAGFVACALCAIAASQGQHAIAEAVLEMSSPEVAGQFLEWHFDQ